ncbi:DUF3329 domain-containing protein [Vagococcus sp. JNUCC 83]
MATKKRKQYNHKHKQIKEKPFLRWLVLGISFVAIFTLNQLTYFTSDDYAYHYVYKGFLPTENAEKIHGISSIITSQITHYKLWNGRYLAHSIVQFFLQYNKIIFNLFNTLAFLLLAYLIYSIVNTVSKVKKPSLLLAQIITLLWLIIPSFGQTVLWVSGSGNYLWTSLFYTGFLLLCLKNLDDHMLTILVSIIVGFLSGATNENSGPATILTVLLIFLFNLIVKKKFHAYQLIGAVFSILGFISMMSSAGSQKRGHIDLSMDVLLKNLDHIFQSSMLHFYFIYLLILILLLILSLSKKITGKDIYFIILLFIGHFACIYSLILISEQPLRILFGASVYSVIITAYLLNRLSRFKSVQTIITIGLLLFSTFNYYQALKDNLITYSQVKEQVAILNRASQNDDIVLPMITRPTTSYNAYNGTANLTDNQNAWFNKWMAQFFHVKSITGQPRG